MLTVGSIKKFKWVFSFYSKTWYIISPSYDQIYIHIFVLYTTHVCISLHITCKFLFDNLDLLPIAILWHLRLFSSTLVKMCYVCHLTIRPTFKRNTILRCEGHFVHFLTYKFSKLSHILPSLGCFSVGTLGIE